MHTASEIARRFSVNPFGMPNFMRSKNGKMENITAVSWQIRNLGKIRVPRIDPSRQVSMSAARAGLKSPNWNQNLTKITEEHRKSYFWTLP